MSIEEAYHKLEYYMGGNWAVVIYQALLDISNGHQAIDFYKSVSSGELPLFLEGLCVMGSNHYPESNGYMNLLNLKAVFSLLGKKRKKEILDIMLTIVRLNLKHKGDS